MDNKPLEVPGKAQAEYSSRHKREKKVVKRFFVISKRLTRYFKKKN